MVKYVTVCLLLALPVGFAKAADGSGAGSYDIRDFGAVSGGKSLCTEAIQDAVDRCAAGGGGTVRCSAGTWLTGTIYLADNVTIHLDSGCTILGSREKKHYGAARELPAGGRFSSWAIFAGRDLSNIAICGRGVVDGQGSNFKYKNGARPKNIYFEGCSDVLIEGVRLRNAGSWMQHYRDCDRLVIRDIAVFSHVSYNNDGLNIDSCRDVVVSGCVIDSDDDAIVLKSLSQKPCRNVTISDCIVSSHCNAIKMGTESGGGFQDITVGNCTICSPRYSEVIYGRQRGLAGLALEIVDGGTLERVTVSNITIKGVTVPIFMRLGDRGRIYGGGGDKPDTGTLRNVSISNIIATDCSAIGCSITGLPGHNIENVTLSNINLGFDGGGTRGDADRAIPEKAGSYPESTMFGTLSAYGFFCRHVRGLELNNVRLRTSEPDHRPALVFDDVHEAGIDSIRASCSAQAAAMISLHNSTDVAIRNCRPPRTADLFVSVSGRQARDICLYNNRFLPSTKGYEATEDVASSAVRTWANHTGR